MNMPCSPVVTHYSSEEEALAVAEARLKQSGTSVAVYQCECGNGWRTRVIW